ncbi:MAG: DUF1367 family protein [Pseudomonadota bacterium]
MTDIVLTKAANGTLVPIDPQAVEFLAKIKLGGAITATVKRHRNPGLHRKWFALLNLAFEHWEPATATYKGQVVGKNFDQFRNDITVLAGHFEMAVNLRGETRLTAKSVSFSSMSQDDFDDLYNATINVILARVMTTYTADDLNRVVDEILRFT